MSWSTSTCWTRWVRDERCCTDFNGAGRYIHVLEKVGVGVGYCTDVGAGYCTDVGVGYCTDVGVVLVWGTVLMWVWVWCGCGVLY